MAKTFTKNEPAINMTMVGFGQAGTRIADRFAEFTREDGKPVYNCLALNSNDGDLKGLKYIPESNRVSLDLGGLGKNPEKAVRILEENENAKDKLKSFIREKIRPTDELVVFFAGLGGGTGTSTIIKAIDEFADFTNKPKIQDELKNLQKEVSPEEFKKDLKKYIRQATLRAEESFIKIGVVVTLPLRADGPDVLRQVNNFTDKIWEISKNKTKGVAFVIFADNQHFYDEFKDIPANEREKGIENYREYANKKIADIFHELNTATTGGGTDVTFDSADFRRVILERTGSLVINRLTKPAKSISNGDDLKSMFLEASGKSAFHQPIQLVDEKTNEVAKVHHIGLLAVLDQSNAVDSGFLDESRIEVVEKLPLQGSVFTGYLTEKNDYSSSVYTFFKTDALPERLAKGLVDEYTKYMDKQKELKFKSSAIATIESTHDDDDEFDIDITDFGFTEEAAVSLEEGNKDDDLEIDISNIDLSVLDEE